MKALARRIARLEAAHPSNPLADLRQLSDAQLWRIIDEGFRGDPETAWIVNLPEPEKEVAIAQWLERVKGEE